MSKSKNIPVIAIVLPDLRGGGAERVFVNLAHAFVDKGCSVDFVLMKAQGELLPKLPSGARVVDLRARRIRNALKPLVGYLRQNKPEAVIAVMWPLTIIGIIAHRYARSSGCLVVNDQNNLSSTPQAGSWFKRIIMRLSMRIFYPLADFRSVVSIGVANDICKLSGLSKDYFKVIHNAVVMNSENEFDSYNPWEKIRGKKILAVGSFKTQKDHKTLIRAFSILCKSVDSTLVILGEGELRTELESLVKESNLTDKVIMPGFISDPASWYRYADLFVLSSRWEGLPMVLLEALKYGLPIVSTNCPSGPAEILDNGRYGKLVRVGDTTGLAEAMTQSLTNIHREEILMERARDFSVERIADQYIELFRFGKNA